MGRARLLALIAALVTGSLAGGAAYALAQATGPGTTSLAVSTPFVAPTPSATASPTPVDTPSPTPSPTVSPSPSPTASPTVSPTPPPTASPKPRQTVSPAPATYPYPKPTRTYAGLTPHASLSQSTGTTNTVFTIKGYATDGDGKAYFAGLQWDDPDGGDVTGNANPTHCQSFPKPTHPGSTYSPEPSSVSYGPYSHTFATPGEYTVTVQVRSVNADCKPNGPAPETATLTFNIVVAQA